MEHDEGIVRLKKLRSQRKLLAEEVAYLRGKLRIATSLKSRERLGLRRKLKRKVTDLKEKREIMKLERKWVDQRRAMKAKMEEIDRECDRLALATFKQNITVAFAYHCQRLHSGIARRMNLRLRDLFHDLLAEKDLYEWKDGGWWEETRHCELFVHLQALGFRKDQWQVTLGYATCDEIPLEFHDSSITKTVDNDRELLSSEGADKALEPEEIEVFAKILKEFAPRQFE